MMMRSEKRKYDEIRSIKITYDVCESSAGSVLFEIGKTKVLCNVTIQNGTPHFFQDKKSGWLTAEYSMIPPATQVRTVREASIQRRNSRSLEISRLIGRVFRTVVLLDKIAQKTIFIDCDVIQADGGTRAAAITGSWLALKLAEERWLEENVIAAPMLTEDVAAISVGIKDGQCLLDLDYPEDLKIDCDFNFVLTRSGSILEIQGTAEKSPLLWRDFDSMKQLALNGVDSLFLSCDELVDEK